MKLCGNVDSIIYRNSENGYTVLQLDASGKPETCVGSFATLSEGENVEFEGEYKTTKYGEQFVVSSFTIKPPETEEAITRYLASGLIRGIGEKTATAIVDKFGMKSLEILDQCPERLAEIKGISKVRALEFAKSAYELRDMRKAVMFLQKYQVTVNMAIKIYKTYEGKTEEVLVRNPYRLIEDVEGIGFLTADRIAQSMGVDESGEFRLRAGLLYTLKEYTMLSGSTYIERKHLMEETKKLLRLSASMDLSTAERLIDGLIVDGLFSTFMREDTECVALTEFYRIEKLLAVKLIKLRREFTAENIECEEEIKEYERINRLTLHEVQREAVKSAVANGIVVITGGPGTGKTTIIKCILYVFRNHRVKTMLCAPTGRAAKRLSESTGDMASTIHRLLDLDYKDGKGYFTYNENTRLPCDACIVDEVSMVDCYLMNCLLRAIDVGKRVILVGDKDQLPSVSAGNVLSDIIESKLIPVIMLHKIYRQSDGSQIVANAHRINEGELPVFEGRNSDFLLCERDNPEDILSEILTMYTQRIPRFLNIEPTEIQVLAPLKKGCVGVENLNKRLQALVNPKEAGQPEFIGDSFVFRAGDKVMQTVNNYQMEWRKNNGSYCEQGIGLFNGDIGTIQSVARATEEVTVLFDDGRTAVYNVAEITDLTLAYCISIHKSQGCEFDVVILPITSGRPSLFNRNLLYTAITRAKRLVVLVGRKENIQRMVENDYTEKRYTMLCEFIKVAKRELDTLYKSEGE